jgi:hypothetical protein
LHCKGTTNQSEKKGNQQNEVDGRFWRFFQKSAGFSDTFPQNRHFFRSRIESFPQNHQELRKSYVTPIRIPRKR